MKPNKAGSHCNKAINSLQPIHSKKKATEREQLEQGRKHSRIFPSSAELGVTGLEFLWSSACFTAVTE